MPRYFGVLDTEQFGNAYIATIFLSTIGRYNYKYDEQLNSAFPDHSYFTDYGPCDDDLYPGTLLCPRLPS